MLGPMNKNHIKEINNFFDEKFRGIDYIYDKDIKNASPLVGGDMAYTHVGNGYFSALIINSAKSGDDPGFNVFMAWGKSKDHLLEFFSNQIESRHKDAVNEVACLNIEYLWDPSWVNKRENFFGWFSFRARGISLRKLIEGEMPRKQSNQEIKEEVRPACEEAWAYISRYAIPFLQNLHLFVGKSYEEIALKFDELLVDKKII